MDLRTLARIDDDLRSSEVAALCFLCRDVLHKKGLETDAKDLFKQLDEKNLLSNRHFLSQLLHTIKREDLLSLLDADGPQTDSSQCLTDYRVMLYNLYEDMTEKNVIKMAFLLRDSGMGRGQIERCTTALEVFSLMENSSLLSPHQLDQLHTILQQCDSQLAITLKQHMNGVSAPQPPCSGQPISDRDRPHVSMDNQRVCPEAHPPCSLSVPEMRPHSDTSRPSAAVGLFSDSDPSEESPSLLHQEFYALRRNPRGTCLVINNEHFQDPGSNLRNRPGTQEDEKALQRVFGKLGFHVEVCSDLTAGHIRSVLEDLGGRSFVDADVLVVCVLSHGENECVFGTDGQKVALGELRRPFTSERAPTLAGKPKLFFIQACQGNKYQSGAVPVPPRPQEEESSSSRGSSMLEEDAGVLPAELVASDADFLMGMATVEDYKSFRNTSTGSIYIQELCKQLLKSAESNDDLLTTLTRVNREVSKGKYLSFKQMPQPKYTLTKKLVLTEMTVVPR